MTLNATENNFRFLRSHVPALGIHTLLYSTVDKTSRLKMKSFSTVRDTHRGSQSYMGEEKREEGVRGDPNEMRWNQKRREKASQ